jgi:hypothetical protein
MWDKISTLEQLTIPFAASEKFDDDVTSIRPWKLVENT